MLSRNAPSKVRCLLSTPNHFSLRESTEKCRFSIITTDKTTSLIFPYPITHVDKGTKDVLVEQVKEASNILLVKAATANFPETNLSVVTGDGSVYSFPVIYEKNPLTWVYTLPSQISATPERYASSISDNPQTMHGIRCQKWDMRAKVSGIYIHENTIYY